MAAENPFVEFVDRYYAQPVLLVQEILGGDPDEHQRAAMMAVARGERRVSLRSGHGVGKTTLLAWILVWWALTRFPQKAVCTAPTSAQLFDALASETKAWFKKLPPQLLSLFEIGVEKITLLAAPDESFISFKTSRAETPEALAGIHSLNVLLIGDEASGIPEPVYEAAAGSMSGHNATTILAGNPVRTSGLFFDTFHKLRDMWVTFHISAKHHPRVSDDFCTDIARRYGEDSNAYRVRVLGEFPKGDADTVIPFELVEAATLRDVLALNVLPIWGVDCARFGDDYSALAVRKGNTLAEPTTLFPSMDTMQLVGRVKAKWDDTQRDQRPSSILVDVIGIGAGVVDRLSEMQLPVRGINVSESPSLGELYANLRSELWFKGKDWFARKDCSVKDEALAAELIAPRFKYNSNGTKLVESKDSMKKRGIASPNRADAFLLTLAEDAVRASGEGAKAAWGAPLKRRVKGF